jgi:hypothetical protein
VIRVANEGSDDRNGRELPRWVWIGIPWAFLAAMPVVRLIDHDLHHRLFKTKEGFTEWATVVVLLPGLWAGVGIWRRRRTLPARSLVAWLGVVTLAALYFAGEEMSWGQHLLHWSTPDFLARRNVQGETNLHNLKGMGIFDNFPRYAIWAWALVAGVVVPWLVRRGRLDIEAGSAAAWFWPTWCCFWTALMAVLIRVPDRIDKLTGKQLAIFRDLRLSEPQEFYFALLLAIYLLSVRARLARS